MPPGPGGQGAAARRVNPGLPGGAARGRVHRPAAGGGVAHAQPQLRVQGALRLPICHMRAAQHQTGCHARAASVPRQRSCGRESARHRRGEEDLHAAIAQPRAFRMRNEALTSQA